MNRLIRVLPLITLAICLTEPAATYADTFDIPPFDVGTPVTFDLFGMPGSTIQVVATINNNTGTAVFLDSDAISPTTPPPTITDLFSTNAPLSITAGTSATFEWFDVTIDASTLVGTTYPGLTATIQDLTTDPLNPKTVASLTFDVTAVPEPSTVTLLGGALVLIAFASRRIGASHTR